MMPRKALGILLEIAAELRTSGSAAASAHLLGRCALSSFQAVVAGEVPVGSAEERATTEERFAAAIEALSPPHRFKTLLAALHEDRVFVLLEVRLLTSAA
jgi:hypothetical protein